MPGSNLIPQTWSHLGEFSSHVNLPSHGLHLAILSHIGAELSLTIIHSGTFKWNCWLWLKLSHKSQGHNVVSFPGFLPIPEEAPSFLIFLTMFDCLSESILLTGSHVKIGCGQRSLSYRKPLTQETQRRFPRDKLPRRLKWHAWHFGTLVSSALCWAMVKTQGMTFHEGFLRFMRIIFKYPEVPQ